MGDSLPTVDIGTGHTAKVVRAGSEQTCVVRDDDRVACWGSSLLGELGNGSQNGTGDAPGEMGDALPTIDLGSGRTIVEFAEGEDHLCALLDDDSLKCWGWNGFGQLGLGDTNNRGDNPGEMGDALPAIGL